MRYGYFDDKNKEYVITKPDTPAPWVNYLGSPEYGAIISNNATGYSFAKSGANGRIIRHRFNSLSCDAPGRYIYIKDNDNLDYWSGSWAPVCKSLEEYKSECRHGLGYTVISSEYSFIKTETTYLVPLNEEYEVWQLKLTNLDKRTRNLSVIGCCEFVNHSNFMSDLINLQNSLFLTSSHFRGNYIYQFHRFEPGAPMAERFFGLADQKIDAYCGERDSFLGKYRGYQNPVGVETGLKNELNYNLNAVGALETKVTLKPDETLTFTYVLGQKDEPTAKRIIAKYENKELFSKQLNEIKEFWAKRIESLYVNTPDKEFNSMVNIWNAYNCYMTFVWSRAASLIYCGLRNGYGYRDTVQDIQGIIHLSPELAREQIEFMLSAQVTKGAGLPLVKYTHNAGYEGTPDEESYVAETGHPSYRADDALWLFPTVYKYVAESGNVEFLDKQICFANSPETVSVYDHLKRAIKFSAENLGNHGMPAGLYADWNDGLRLGAKGESTFVAFQLILAIDIMLIYAGERNDNEYIDYLNKLYAEMSELIDKCWDEDRFIRGYTEDGLVIGKHTDKEASMWLNPQSFAVISGFAKGEKAEKAMESVNRELVTPYGAMLFSKPYKDYCPECVTGIQYANAYSKENAGIFSQPQGWLILAETKLGHGNRAYEYWRNVAPACYNDNAELRAIEPYAHGQFTEGAGSPYVGRSHVHWLTGTASTVMVASVEGILGIKPESKGIVIDPCIPSKWTEFTIRKIFRGKVLNIKVINKNGKEHGVSQVTVNGKKQAELLIKDAVLLNENDIIIEM